jgi:hypothetical protein
MWLDRMGLFLNKETMDQLQTQAQRQGTGYDSDEANCSDNDLMSLFGAAKSSVNTVRASNPCYHLCERANDRRISKRMIERVKKNGYRTRLENGRVKYELGGVVVVCGGDNSDDNVDITTWRRQITGKWRNSWGVYRFTESESGAAFVGVSRCGTMLHLGVGTKQGEHERNKEEEKDLDVIISFHTVVLSPNEVTVRPLTLCLPSTIHMELGEKRRMRDDTVYSDKDSGLKWSDWVEDWDEQKNQEGNLPELPLSAVASSLLTALAQSQTQQSNSQKNIGLLQLSGRYARKFEDRTNVVDPSAETFFFHVQGKKQEVVFILRCNTPESNWWEVGMGVPTYINQNSQNSPKKLSNLEIRTFPKRKLMKHQFTNNPQAGTYWYQNQAQDQKLIHVNSEPHQNKQNEQLNVNDQSDHNTENKKSQQKLLVYSKQSRGLKYFQYVNPELRYMMSEETENEGENKDSEDSSQKVRESELIKLIFTKTDANFSGKIVETNGVNTHRQRRNDKNGRGWSSSRNSRNNGFSSSRGRGNFWGSGERGGSSWRTGKGFS